MRSIHTSSLDRLEVFLFTPEVAKRNKKGGENYKMELFTVQEAADRLKTNPHLVYKLIKAGAISALKLGRIKIPDYELERFIRGCEGLDITDPTNVKPFNADEAEPTS